MKYEVMKQWVEALRSGKYEQTTGFLHRLNGYCCLGVLCDISKLSKWETSPDTARPHIGNGIYNYLGAHRILPPQILEWAEIGGGISDLVQKNDEGTKFKEIANYIEANWRKL